MDEAHLAAAVRYVALNPVRARLVRQPTDWRWSSVHAHLSATDDGITALWPILERFPRFAEFIETDLIQPCLPACAVPKASGDRSAIRRLSIVWKPRRDVRLPRASAARGGRRSPSLVRRSWS